jgi:Domain of unknown function (DUF4157)
MSSYWSAVPQLVDDSYRDHEAEAPFIAPGRRTLTASMAPSADTIATRVARIMRHADAGAARDADGVAAGADAMVARAGGSAGAPLRPDVRERFEASLGVDLSAVRVHTGAPSAEAAGAIGAQAYAIGNDVHFADGKYRPEDPFGLHLLAHEVAHTVQQAGAPRRQHKLEVSDPSDAAEVQADAAADAMVAGHSYQLDAIGGGAVHRNKDKKPSEADKKKYADDKKYAEGIMKQAEAVQQHLLDRHTKEMDAISAIGNAAGTLVETYDKAFSKHEAVVKKANEVYEDRQKMLDFALGIAVGVATGGASAAFGPASEVAFSVGRSFAEEFISQVVSTGASSVLDIKKTVNVATKENKEAQRWKMIADLFRDAADNVPELGRVSKLAQGATKVVGDCNAAAGGIALSFFADNAALDKAIAALRASKAESALAAAETKIATGWKELLRQQYSLESKAQNTTVGDLEKDIWLQWMATLAPQGFGKDREYDQIDNDEIENYLTGLGLLGKHGSLGHDAGDYTTAEDERILQASAAEKVRVLQMVGAVGKVEAGSDGLRLWTKDYRSVACAYPSYDNYTGYYKVVGATQRNGKTKEGEKRVEWIAELDSLAQWEVEDLGLAKNPSP